MQAFKASLRSLPSSGRVQLQTDQATGVAVLTLRNEARRNALCGTMMIQLADAVHELESWKQGVALVVTGAGRAFCAGADLHLAQKVINTPEQGQLMSELMSETLDRIAQLPMISVCAVNGAAFGGGAELTTATDWRVFASGATARFVQTQMAVSTGWGGAGRLTGIVGRRQALRLFLHSPLIDAEAALASGLADAVAPEGVNPADAAMELFVTPALRAAGSRAAIRSIKAAVAAHSSVSAGARRAETQAFASVWASADNLRAVQKALERAPSKV